jgi:hypothetical protein
MRGSIFPLPPYAFMVLSSIQQKATEIKHLTFALMQILSKTLAKLVLIVPEDGSL